MDFPSFSYINVLIIDELSVAANGIFTKAGSETVPNRQLRIHHFDGPAFPDEYTMDALQNAVYRPPACRVHGVFSNEDKGWNDHQT